ncbi:phosphoesterase [Jannaschia pagri]|uniref:Phosphoesterase n=2 Tax=Roseobacteraceae TaxID=2854170 RepID=A0ABQ4NP49_9RHOB|nr:phosphoesterase [Jannaschia sp. AI_61]GIT96175.1 phosphoesterase [Jannaschia sp. AI_62]
MGSRIWKSSGGETHVRQNTSEAQPSGHQEGECVAPLGGATNDVTLVRGPWAVVCSKGQDHDDYGLAIPGDGALRSTQATGTRRFRTTALDGASWAALKGSPPNTTAREALPKQVLGLDVAPEPRLGSDQLAAEMAELYAMAILRDKPFEELRDGQHGAATTVHALRKMSWFDEGAPTPDRHMQPQTSEGPRGKRNRLSPQSLFRAAAPGCAVGPYVSQFLLIGNSGLTGGLTPDMGFVTFGTQRMSQMIARHVSGVDYMRDWAEWLDVQDGADTASAQAFDGTRGFICTPRDLSARMRQSAPEEPFVTAYYLLLAAEAAADDGLPEPTSLRSSAPPLTAADVLSLISEAASAAQVLLAEQAARGRGRLQPEVLGALATLVTNGEGARLGAARPLVETHVEKLEAAATANFDLLEAVNQMPTTGQFGGEPKGPPFQLSRNLMLPMAFAEGAPKEAAFGARQATVAGACATLLKAMFKISTDGAAPLTLDQVGTGTLGTTYVPNGTGSCLVATTAPEDAGSQLTLQGELNKLAANVALARSFAGIHTYGASWDAMRMGERLAVGLLLDRLAASDQPASLTFESFDGDALVLSGDGQGAATLLVEGGADPSAWWHRLNGEVAQHIEFPKLS